MTEEEEPEPLPSQKTAIGLRTALLLYGLLIVAALVRLKGKALIFALVIVVALAGKSLVQRLRERAED